MEEVPKKKRGRKPKKFNMVPNTTMQTICEDNVISDEEQIILHLPITMNDLNDNVNDIFIKSESIFNKDMGMLATTHVSNATTVVSTCESQEDTIDTSPIRMNFNNNVNKIVTHKIKVSSNTKCWWCRNKFMTESVQLPEDYYNETFFCIGHFCSYNCAKSYNLSLNDYFVWKRESLINLLYFLTYNERKDISCAPHWISLEEYGGKLTIDQFRKNSIINTKEYLVLHPPLISREMQIEESYKINKLKEVSIDKINKIYSEIDSDYTMKRSKPIQSSQLNLETTMGLIKTRKVKKIVI